VATPHGAKVACAHCGLDMPRERLGDGGALPFCCHGCQTVYELVHGCGLDRYYALREASPVDPVPARTTGRRYSELDEPEYLNATATTLAQGVRSVEFYLEGVHCAACVWLVEKLPRVAPGVLEARLDLGRALVRVVWDERQVRLSRVAQVLDSLGYPPHPARDVRTREARVQGDRKFLVRIAVAAVAAGNVMLLAFALYGGAFEGPEREYGAVFRWVSMALGLTSLAWPGSLFFRGAWASIRTRTAHLDLPIALGLAAGATGGAVNTVLGRGEVYFDSLTVLVLLLLVGRFVQHRQQRRAADAIELLFSLTPSFARRVEADGVQEVPIEALHAGDLVQVLAGESFPADGEVVEGESSVDQSLLTGESQPLAVGPGAKVCAGAVNVSRALRFRVEAAGAQTRAGKLMRLVEEYTQRKAPIVRLADRIAGYFVVTVVGLAALTLGVWLWLDPSQAIGHATALLIVTCPCALGLSTPLALAVAIGRAARRGILIKGGDALERLARPSRLLLDKTGTITEGGVARVEWEGDASVRPLVAALEAHSSHPVALALREAAEGDPLLLVEDVAQTSGAGIDGRVAGRQVSVGAAHHVLARVESGPAWAQMVHERFAAKAMTPVWVAVDGKVVAVVGVGKPVRGDAAAAVKSLRELGFRPGILSGDDPGVVESVARLIGVDPKDCRGGVTAEEKVALMDQEARREPVVMVGDGVNDAAALSAATVGIAVHGGAEASLAAADVYLATPGLRPIVDLVLAAKNTLRTIRLCLAVSLVYNAVAAALAVTGIISPLLAAVLMPLSSFSVVAVAAGMPTFPKAKAKGA
jgi:Cu2+-exporting ATPase